MKMVWTREFNGSYVVLSPKNRKHTHIITKCVNAEGEKEGWILHKYNPYTEEYDIMTPAPHETNFDYIFEKNCFRIMQGAKDYAYKKLHEKENVISCDAADIKRTMIAKEIIDCKTADSKS